jgi:hypothetical protein
MAPTGKNRIMIYGPKTDGSYIVEFRIADGESLAISVPGGETWHSVFRHDHPQTSGFFHRGCRLGGRRCQIRYMDS